MKDIFDDDSKIKAFDRIAELFYNRNFSLASKNQIELLMFDIYLKKLISDNNDSSAYSDYELSSILGITPSRVNNLKEKDYIVYPGDEYDWKSEFKKIIDKAEEENGRIKLYIKDWRLYREIKKAIEDLDGYTETQLTKNLIVVNPLVFIDLIVKIYATGENTSDRETAIKILKENLKKTAKAVNLFWRITLHLEMH